MSSSNSGGSAFPVNENRRNEGEFKPSPGLTRRDYFAAHVDIPWNACIDALSKGGSHRPTNEEVIKYRVKLKLLEADLLLNSLDNERSAP